MSYNSISDNVNEVNESSRSMSNSVGSDNDLYSSINMWTSPAEGEFETINDNNNNNNNNSKSCIECTSFRLVLLLLLLAMSGTLIFYFVSPNNKHTNLPKGDIATLDEPTLKRTRLGNLGLGPDTQAQAQAAAAPHRQIKTYLTES